MKLNRRELLKSGGAAAASVALLQGGPLQTAADASANPNALWGVVVRVDLSATTMHVRPVAGPVARVVFPASVAADPRLFNRDGMFGLGAFQPGDEVVIELQSPRTPLVGRRVDTCYRACNARVLARYADRQLVTTKGNFWLPSDVLLRLFGQRDIQTTPSELKTGVHVAITARLDPSRHRQLARLIVIGVPV